MPSFFGNYDDLYPIRLLKILNDRFIDDFMTSGTDKEFLVMQGQPIAEAKFKYDGVLPFIPGEGELQLKGIVQSGENDPDGEDKLGRSVLALGWNAEEDILSIYSI